MNLNKILESYKSNIEGHKVYRFLDDDNIIIYVGRTSDIFQRMKSHTNIGDDDNYKNITSIEYTTLDNYIESVEAEKYFISKYKPKFNKQHIKKYYEYNNELENLKWTVYRSYPIDSIKYELEQFYEEGLSINFNLSKLWLYINYLNVSTESWNWSIKYKNQLSHSFDKELLYLMNSVHNELIHKIDRQLKKKYQYLRCTGIGERIYTDDIGTFFDREFFQCNLLISDKFENELVEVGIMIEVKDCK